jgi:hypothetical protein
MVWMRPANGSGLAECFDMMSGGRLARYQGKQTPHIPPRANRASASLCFLPPNSSVLIFFVSGFWTLDVQR